MFGIIRLQIYFWYLNDWNKVYSKLNCVLRWQISFLVKIVGHFSNLSDIISKLEEENLELSWKSTYLDN